VTLYNAPLRVAAVAASVLSCLTMASCAATPTAVWEGEDRLAEQAVEVPGYEAVAALPDLTAKQVAKAAGLTDAATVTPEVASGDGWRAGVEHSPFVTRIQTARECAEPTSDGPDATDAIAKAQAVFAGLGADPDEQTWFTVAGAEGDARVYAEPNLDGVQTWSTGIFVARVDDDGVCAVSASLMAFEATDETTTLASPREAFLVVDGGTYSTVEQTYTLGSAGRLTPVWRFAGDDGAAVAVDLGDGLESAPDTETFLNEATSN
jgi:hypothetical protein